MNIGRIRKVEIWITNPILSEDGWSNVKSFLFLRTTNSDGVEGWGEAFVSTTSRKRCCGTYIKSRFFN